MLPSSRQDCYRRKPRPWEEHPERHRSVILVAHRRAGPQPRPSGPGIVVAAILACGIALLAIAFMAVAAPNFPELKGRITDLANLLSAEDKAAIEADLTALEAKSTDQIAVVTVPTLQGYTIEDYGYQLGRHWGIGQAGKDNGALLIVAPTERKVRIEVGRRLEPLLTDTMSSVIVQNSILPRFRRGDFSGGVRAGVTDMKDVLLGDAEAVKERAKGGRADGEVDWIGLIFIAIWIGIFLYIMYAQYKYAQQFPNSTRANTRNGRDGGIVVIPGGSSDWGGGWDSGGSGGGWSGGGGDFGGGGASGSW